VKAWKTVARAPDDLILQERDGVFVVRFRGRELMSSVQHHSEEEMARLALEQVRERKPAVLVGGLGLGYSVRATLDASPACHVVVAELSPDVVEWNRTFVADLAKRPLEDPRVEVVVDDVAAVMRKRRAGFDCILLDVDNGPSAMSTASNQLLYERQGIAAMKAALRPGGVAVVWSAGPDAKFLRRLGEAGLDARAENSPARLGGSRQHVLFVAALSASRRRVSR
jgi:spermidine synthase